MAEAPGAAALPTAFVEPERRLGRWAAGSAAASVVTLIAALLVANATAKSAGGEASGGHQDRYHELVNFHDSPSGQALAAGLRCAGLLLGIGVGLFLFWLVRRRGAPVPRWVLWSAVAGPVLVAGATVFGFLAMRDVSDAFFASGPRTLARASDLIEHSSRLHLASVFDIGSRIVFAAWVGALSVYALRLGLLTTFLGYWGVGAAGALILLPIGDAMYIGWLASMAALAWGYWPGGRPEAWTKTAPAAPGGV